MTPSQTLSAFILRDENPSQDMSGFSGVCACWVERDYVALHLLNQSGAVFSDTSLPLVSAHPTILLLSVTPKFLHLHLLTPRHTHTHNSTAPHSSWEQPHKGASQVCAWCFCESILHGWRIDCMHKVKRTSRTRAARQGPLKYFERDSASIIFMCSSGRPACVPLWIITCLCNVLCVHVVEIHGCVIVSARIQAGSFLTCAKKKGRFFRVR